MGALKFKFICVVVATVTALPSVVCAQVPGEYRTFGILGGFSFPKVLFAKFQINLAENFAIDYEPSLGIFWTIQQGDLTYYFSRSDWSPYVSLGIQKWNFFGFSTSTNYNGVIFGGSNSATSVTVPLGLQYVSESGFALDLAVAADVFVDAPNDLKGKVVPEGQLAIGVFF